MKQSLVLTALALAVFTLGSCNDSGSKTASKTSTEAPSATLDSYFVSTAPSGAVAVGEARKALSGNTEEIIVEGLLANNGPVFHPKAAMFFICDDSKIKKGSEEEEAGHDHAEGESHEGHDHAKEEAAELDWCCTDAAVIKDALLSVQIVDQAGTPIAASLNGVHNMKENERVIIKGKPAPKASADAPPILNVTEIYVVPSKNNH